MVFLKKYTRVNVIVKNVDVQNIQSLLSVKSNSPGHSLYAMKVLILEQVKIRSSDYRKEKEKYFINKFNTFHEGMNRRQ